MKSIPTTWNAQNGFTLLEVLVATVVFVLAVLAIGVSRTNSLRSTREARFLTDAVLLSQSKMAELEIEYQKAIDKSGVESSFGTQTGKFEKPFEDFSWTAELKESSLDFKTETLVQFLSQLGIDPETAQAEVENQGLLIGNLNKALKENYAELRVEVSWMQFGRKKTLPVVTHLLPAKPKITLTLEAAK